MQQKRQAVRPRRRRHHSTVERDIFGETPVNEIALVQPQYAARRIDGRQERDSTLVIRIMAGRALAFRATKANEAALGEFRDLQKLESGRSLDDVRRGDVRLGATDYTSRLGDILRLL